ncbi:MAG: efflux RND transporter permease subunit, partial [Candidatus Marinimicrobia bacterium]|nr:efflux RND transporter permease subunit [Candidatus Neomarinimicrobiota bacterium]
KPEDLQRYGLTINDISQAIRSENINISAGSIVTNREEILIRSYEKEYFAEGLEDIKIMSHIDGQEISLSEICTIKEQWPENRFYTESRNNISVGMNIMYNNNEDVIEIADLLDKKLEEYNDKYLGLVEFEPLIRDVDELNERLGTLTKNGLIGLFMVLFILGFFLNLRLSFWVALGIPISFMGLFFVQWMMGVTINEMSLFGMIMVIGILVDDAIIIGESIYSKWEREGMQGFEAAIEGTMDVIRPVGISVITTIVAFSIYLSLYGELGRYVWQIGLMAIISLSISLIEAAIILPAHLAHSKALTDKNKINKTRKKLNQIIDFVIYKLYTPFLNFCLRNRWAVATFVLALIFIIAGAFQGTHIRAQFFPEIEEPFARIEVEIPAGMVADRADVLRDEIIADALEFGKNKAKDDPNRDNAIENYVSWSNGAQISIFLVLPPNVERDYSVNDFSNELAEELGDFPEAESINVSGAAMFGGNPISIRFLSQDYNQLKLIKEDFKDALKKLDGVKDIQDDTPLGSNEFIVTLKDRGKALGLTVRDISYQLRQGFYGQEVMRLQRGRDEVKIWVRFPASSRSQIAQIENLKILTPSGAYIPFKEIAHYKIQRSMKRIRHRDGYRAVRVFANLDYSKNDLSVINKEIDEKILPSILSNYPGVSRGTGGQSEFVQKSIKSMTFSAIMAMILMFTILMFLLKSYAQVILIMSLIPLGFIGAIIGHYIMGIPVSFISFLGSVALAGIIINDSVVLIDKYNKLVKDENLSVFDAAQKAAVLRFRPIIMTTITTAIGLAPLIFEKSSGGQFLVPMAVSIAFGLIFGTLLTLGLLPSALMTIEDMKQLARRLRSGSMSKT